jgi:prepilin-type N-terminal cleavage/methylation domain-containing protein
MKHSFSGPRSIRQSGFTLVELLVVIGIIAILASVILAAGGAAIRAAKRAAAANMASQLQTSCTAYNTEYGVYPVPSTQGATDYVIQDSDGASWATLVEALSGNINPLNGNTVAPTSITNTRGIAFISLKASDLDTVNSIAAPKNPISYDSVGHPYYFIAMDSDYDNILGGTTGTSTGQLPNFATATNGSAPPMTGSSTAGVAVWANCNSSATSLNPAFWVHTY